MVELFFEDTKLELKPDTVIAFTRQVNDLASLEDRQGDHTNRFTIPKSNHNLNTLDIVSSINSASRFPYLKNNFSIVMDGVEIISDGYAVIDAVSEDIEITVYSGNADFFEAIGQKMLSDLDLSDYRLQWTRANIISERTSTDGSFWPIINRGLFDNFAWVDCRALWPAIYVKTVIDKIFSEAGFYKTGDILTDDWYTKLIIPYNTIKVDDAVIAKVCAFKQITEQSWVFTSAGSQFGDLDIDSSVGKVDDYNLFVNGNNGWNYNVKSDGIYTIKVEWRGRRTVVSGGSDITVLKIMSAQRGALALVTLSALTYSADFSEDDTVTAYLKAGDCVYLWWETTITGSNNWTLYFWGTDSSSGRDPTNMDIQNADITDTAFGWHVPCAINMPEIEQRQLLKAIAQMLGIIFSTNNITKEVVFTSIRDIVLNKPNAVDWSNKLDMSKPYELDFRIGDYAQTNHLKYKPTEGPENGIADSSFSIDDEILELEKTLIELVFEPCEDKVCIYEEEAAYIPNLELRKHILTNRQDAGRYYRERYEIDGSWLTFSLGVSGTEAEQWDAEDWNTPTEQIYGECAHWILKPTGPKILRCEILSPTGTKRFYEGAQASYTNVSTSLPVAHFINPVSGKDNLDWESLKTEFYTGLINMLNDCKVVKAYFKLDATDIVGFDFSVPVYVKEFQSMFYVNKIEEFAQGSTLVEMIKL